MTDQFVNKNSKNNKNSKKQKLSSKKGGFATKLKSFFVEESEKEAKEIVIPTNSSVDVISKSIKAQNPKAQDSKTQTSKEQKTMEMVDFVDIPKVVKKPVSAKNTNQKVINPSKSLVSKEPLSGVDELSNMTFGKGINLIITQTEEEVIVEEKKFKLNFTSIFILVIFVTVTILVFGINIAYKLTYNTQVNKVEELKETIDQDYYLITANNKILDRLTFMHSLNEANYSPKQVLHFLNDLTKEYGEILSFTLTTDLDFTIVGSTSSYEAASKLWHLMVVNEDIEYVTIRTISKQSDSKVFITFEGQLKHNSFTKLLEN